MSRIEFVHWVEIPVRVYAEYQEREESTMTYPGCPETVGIDDIDIEKEDGTPLPVAEIKDYILLKHLEELEDAAWEHKD